MVRLLVIADDFTGALDTGVQFRAEKSRVTVYTGDKGEVKRNLAGENQVLIIDAETRHLKPEQAYRIIYEITEMAVNMGVSYIYKKTDSGLRGNIGSELTAFWRASGEKQIHFLPAFPQMGRVTKDGIHYIDGVRVADSVFGRDPFEPVRRSAVKEIIAEQSDAPVSLVSESRSPESDEGIWVYDSSTEEEMIRLGTGLKQTDRLHFLAGCAGFASVLFRLLELKTAEPESSLRSEKMLVICGSVNAVTVKQLEYAAREGIKTVSLRPEEKLGDAWPDSAEGAEHIRRWAEYLRENRSLIIECGVTDLEQTAGYAAEKGLSQEETRKRIAETMGSILKKILCEGAESTLLVTGGDTLLAFMQQIHINTLEPVCELVPGVVLSRLEYRGHVYDLISKSGGFGPEDLIVRLLDKR